MPEIDGIWRETHTVGYYHTDATGRMALSMLQSLLADAAGNHAHHHAISLDCLHDKQRAWVMNKIDISVGEYPQWRDKIEIFTWVKAMRGAVSMREFAIRNIQRDAWCVLASSTWALIDTVSLRPARIADLQTTMPLRPEGVGAELVQGLLQP